jgi:hypothetical protein
MHPLPIPPTGVAIQENTLPRGASLGMCYGWPLISGTLARGIFYYFVLVHRFPE